MRPNGGRERVKCRLGKKEEEAGNFIAVTFFKGFACVFCS